nr:hypothetical protein BaRGS_028639 [Batillaria attramentaria]
MNCTGPAGEEICVCQDNFQHNELDLCGRVETGACEKDADCGDNMACLGLAGSKQCVCKPNYVAKTSGACGVELGGQCVVSSDCGDVMDCELGSCTCWHGHAPERKLY